MSGLMQPGPTLYEAEQQRKKRGSMGLLGEIGEPLSYAPGPVGLLGNALLSAQYVTGEKSADEGLSALAMLTGMMQGTKVAPIMRNAIKVYHGSPHKFDKASSEHIGKGEGAQAYGHGLYWAESPKVAEDYATKLAPKGKGGPWWEDMVRQKIAQGMPPNEAKAFVAKHAPDKADEIFKISDDKLEVSKQLYEASLRWPDAAREATDPLSAKHFLDWDKPLGKQNADVFQKIRSAFDSKYGQGFFDKYVGSGADMKDVIQNFDDLGKGGVETMLRQKGIPGITYLDGMSRAAGEGTRNYVTFDDALVELLKRNGVGLLGK